MKPNVHLIGTIHQEKAKLNSDHLLEELNRIKPDLICLELTSDFFTEDFQIPMLTKSKELTLEDMAIKKYLDENIVMLRPFDIEGRNQFYKEQNTFAMQQESFEAIAELYQNNKLTSENKLKFEIIQDFSSLDQVFFDSTLQEINSERMYNYIVIKDKHFARLEEIINTTPELEKYRDFIHNYLEFEKSRDLAMAVNIGKLAIDSGVKTVVAIVGCMHKPYLSELLKMKESINLI